MEKHRISHVISWLENETNYWKKKKNVHYQCKSLGTLFYAIEWETANFRFVVLYTSKLWILLIFLLHLQLIQ